MREEKLEASRRQRSGVDKEEFDEENGYVDEMIDEFKPIMKKYKAPKVDMSKYKRLLFALLS